MVITQNNSSIRPKETRLTIVLLAKPFSSKAPTVNYSGVATMGIENAKTATKALTELYENKTELACTMNDMGQQVSATQKLWREGNKSKLVKIGLSLIIFPEPTQISNIVGAGFVAAGMAKKGIQNQSIFMEDIKKTLQGTLKEISASKHDL